MLIKISNRNSRHRNNHGIIVKQYEHYNSAFRNWDSPTHGKYISSKAHYEKALAEEGMITQKEADRQGLNTGPKRKEYTITPDTQALIESVKQSADKKGRVKVSDRAIEALNRKKREAKFNNRNCPSHYQTTGGFE